MGYLTEANKQLLMIEWEQINTQIDAKVEDWQKAESYPASEEVTQPASNKINTNPAYPANELSTSDSPKHSSIESVQSIYTIEHQSVDEEQVEVAQYEDHTGHFQTQYAE